MLSFRQEADESTSSSSSSEIKTTTETTRETQVEKEKEVKPESNLPTDPLTSIDLFATLFRGDPDGNSGTGAGVVETLRREGLTTLLLLLETSGLLNFLISGGE